MEWEVINNKMLYTNEARITKNGKIVYGSEDTRKLYAIINPLKGSMKELETELRKLLISNNTSILKVKFSNGDTLYFSCISLEDSDIVIYNTLSDAIGKETETCNVTVGRANEWEKCVAKYINTDISICGAIRKGI